MNVITVGSITYAHKAKRILQNAGISAQIIKVDGRKSRHGCTYGIEFPAEFYYDVAAALRNAGIAFSVYPSKDL